MAFEKICNGARYSISGRQLPTSCASVEMMFVTKEFDFGGIDSARYLQRKCLNGNQILTHFGDGILMRSS